MFQRAGAQIHNFFFQAEDGIRDDLVTGVQTCALPIWWAQYDAIFSSRTEWANPGLMFGWTWIRDSGFTVSAGIGCNFAAQATTTRFAFTSSGGYVPLPILTS